MTAATTNHQHNEDDTSLSRINPITLHSDFVQTKATKALRICCYGSSSSETPTAYLDAARSLGYILAKRGHTCVNGAGAYGCMAAMNDGADLGGGHIVGVIHEMWLRQESNVRDGGAHRIFVTPPPQQQQPHAVISSTENAAPTTTTHNETTTQSTTTVSAPNPTIRTTGPQREMLVAGGNDLQERKRMLVDRADALIVLPGGPGTWDELWEMACARGIGLSNLPIVCVNCDGFYDPFHEMLVRAYHDKLTKFKPHELVHFESTAEAAVKWVEATCAGTALPPPCLSLTKKTSMLRKSSMLHLPVTGKSAFHDWFTLSTVQWPWDGNPEWMRTTIWITTGLALGMTLTNTMTRWWLVQR